MSKISSARTMLSIVVATIALGGAIAELDAGGVAAATPPRNVRSLAIGHDNIEVNPAMRRYTGVVTALGSPDAQGRIYSFEAAPIGPASVPPEQDELRGWRLTVLAGNRFSHVFEIRSNTATEVTVTTQDGPLNGLAVRDVFVIEEIAVVRPAPQASSGS